MMWHLWHTINRRVGPVAGACVLLTGGIGASALLGAGTAQAGTCAGVAVNAGTSCTATGQLTFTGGFLSLISPTALTWGATGNGTNQLLFDSNTAHQSYTVNDSSGSGAGWDVTVSATTFTSLSPAATLPNTLTFSTNGSVASQSATTAPTATCIGTNTCTPPTDTTVYPVAFVTAPTTPTALKIYSASANTGMGSFTIGYPGVNAVGWWVAVPANAVAATYTSIVTLMITSGP